jgi:hypothetical protein
MNANTNNMYDIDYFINKLSAIPDEQWGTGRVECDGKYCVMGHCGTIEGIPEGETTRSWILSEETKALVRLFTNCAAGEELKNVEKLYRVNDDYRRNGFNSPKEPIIAQLEAIKASYTVDYFINKLQAIPAEQWATGMVEEDGKHCVLGLCGATDFDAGWRFSTETKALIRIFTGCAEGQEVDNSNPVWETNDNYKERKFATPKDSVLAKLLEIKNKNEK